MLTKDQVQAIKAPFPPEALSKDTSRGFELTSIKAAFVIERLNEVFGPCGIGWRYVHSPFETITGDGKMEVVTEVAFQYRFDATNDCTGCDPAVWDAQAKDLAFRNGASNHDWSEPILACGGKQIVKERVTDARKSAVTDGLTKAASMIGVGHQVFKGQVRVGNGHPQKVRGGQGGNGRGQHRSKPDATAFWTLYNTQGKAAGIPGEKAYELAEKGDWPAACAELRALVAGTTN
jgi:hypothetical protein